MSFDGSPYTIQHLNEIDSTNDYIKQHWTKLNHKCVVIADFQTKGRGQFDRSWLSNKGENLLCSILLKEQRNIEVDDLNQIVIQTLIQVLRDFGIIASFKEPNDIIVNGKKIAGVLIERQFQQDLVLFTVIGIGLNVNQILFEGLNATSMHNEKQHRFNIETVIKALLKYFDLQFNNNQKKK